MSELPNLFPALDSATEAAMRESIRRFGVLVPVVRDQHGRTLDGHHRSRIAGEESVPFRVDVVKVEDDEQAREIAATLNTDRRQMSAGQRREIVAALREHGHSLRAIAGAVGADKKQVQRDLAQVGTLSPPDEVIGQDGKRYPAKRPTLVAAKNEREADRAQAAITGTDLPAGRVLDVKRVERMKREAEAEQRRAEPVAPITTIGDVQIRHGDLRTALSDVRDVSAIITDPPYPAKFLDEFDALGELAARILRPDGVLAALVGQTHLPAYIERISEHIPYRWCGAYLTDGPATRVHGAEVGTKWKPVLIFGASERFLTQDVFVSGGDDKEHHHWGQSESGFADLVERLTDPGDLVVDPFVGGGTSALVCRDLGRRFVGCDVDAGAVSATLERLAA